MFVWTARLSKRRAVLSILVAAAVVALVIFLIAGLRNGGDSGEAQLNTNEDRIAYLQSWGWEIDPEPLETFQLLLPDKLQEPYITYNELQKQQGFDLTACCGKQLARYTYTVTNYPGRPDGVQANLYLCEGEPVAGDVIASGDDGFQTGLAFPTK